MGRKPDFLCIGVQKGGTSSLPRYMNQHPDVFMLPYETSFFLQQSRTGVFTDHLPAYEALFPDREKKACVGEKSPLYGYCRYAIDRIHVYAPHLKLIFILREPISRAYSQYNMYRHRHQGQDLPDPHTEFLREIQINRQLDTLERVGKDYLIQGFYDDHLDYLYQKFPRNQVHIAISEEILQDKQAEYNKIFRFLGVPVVELDLTVDTHHGTYPEPLDPETARVLYRVFQPHVERLYTILGRRIPAWDAYHQSLREKGGGAGR